MNILNARGRHIEPPDAEPFASHDLHGVIVPPQHVDLRVEKDIPLAAGRRLGLIADLFNLTNQGVPDSDLVVPVIENSGPALGLPAAWRRARQLRVGLRLEF